MVGIWDDEPLLIREIGVGYLSPITTLAPP